MQGLFDPGGGDLAPHCSSRRESACSGLRSARPLTELGQARNHHILLLWNHQNTEPHQGCLLGQFESTVATFYAASASS